MSEFLEVMMLICFGFSWPISVIKSYKARTTKGKSVFFILAIIVGYLCGITSKFLSGNINYVLIFYFFNLIIVSVDLLIYFRNKHLDKLQESGVYKTENKIIHNNLNKIKNRV